MAQIQKPAQQVKFIDGQVFICNPVLPNFDGQLPEPSPYQFGVSHLIRIVKERMEHCMGQLLKAHETGQIVRTIYHDDIVEIHFSTGEAFHSGSYAVMESLLKKLEANTSIKGLDIHQMYELLTCREADQLFKAWLQIHQWGSRACLLDCLRDDLRRKEQKTPNYGKV